MTCDMERQLKENRAKGNGKKTFTPPKEGTDWVLVIDDASKNFQAPGTKTE